jgi:K(+)-stimulated pyrophosphate-energized sodium pump
MPSAYLLVIACGVLALLYGLVTSRQVLTANAGSARMQEISGAVLVGARAYLNRQYRAIAVVGAVVLIVLGVTLCLRVAIGYLIGAVLSAAAGYIGMNVSVRANVRTAQAARSSLKAGLAIAFKAGAVTGLLVVGLGLLGVGIYYFVLRAMMTDDNLRPVLEAMVALSFGASLISIFARLGGGIFTKGADVGADLVGKVEAGIPEDDPRNPAVIADNVGDNVGDCAGMAADLFETYAVTIVATMLLAAIFFAPPLRDKLLLLPLVIGAVCIVTSVIGTYFVRLGADNGIMKALYKGLVVTGILSVVAIALVIYWLLDRLHRMDHRILYGDHLPAGTEHRAELNDRAWHERDPRPCGVDGGDSTAGRRDLHRHHRLFSNCRFVWDRRGCDDDAGACRHDRRARCVWSGH